MRLSAWERESFFDAQDIIIIGGGLVGLWTALTIKRARPAVKITILERSIIPSGASTRNAGFSCFGSPSELLHDANVTGEDAMWQIVAMRYEGMQRIAQEFKAINIGLEVCGGYEVYDAPVASNTTLTDGIAWLNKGLASITGTPQCFTVADDTLSAFGLSGFSGMVQNQLEGYLHSGKMVQALLQKVQAAGVQFFNSTPVHHWEKINGKWHITAGDDIVFTSEQLVFCTNAFTSRLLPSAAVMPARGQVLLTSPIPELALKGAFHFDEGFYYFRNLGNRVLLGGARNKSIDAETTTHMVTSDVVQAELERFLSHHILNNVSYTIEQRWSGIMGFTPSKTPVISQPQQDLTVALACNGMGVALAPVIAEKVCEMIC